MTTQAIAKPLTGKTVLMTFLGFFGVVFAVNTVFVVAAVSTRPGEEAGASYETGLHYNSTLLQEQAQARLGWRHRLSFQDGFIRLSFSDESGGAVADLGIDAKADRPASSGTGQRLEFREVRPGVYDAPLAVEAGSWVISLSARRGTARLGEPTYRLKQRIWVSGSRS